MTRLYNYLNENKLSISEIITLIEKDCQPFLKDWKKLNTVKFLMSGRKGSFNDFEKKKVRENRKPKDTPKIIHEFVDNWFYKKFGIKARSNSIFCTFNPNLADEFGKLYLIFPIGNYKAISSDKISDLFNIWRKVYYDVTSEFGIIHYRNSEEMLKNLKEVNKFNEFFEELEKELNLLNYKSELVKFHNNEIMLNCKEYYILKARYNSQMYDYFYLGKNIDEIN